MLFELKNLLLNFTIIRFESDKSQGKMLWDYFTLLYYYRVGMLSFELFKGIKEHSLYYVFYVVEELLNF